MTRGAPGGPERTTRLDALTSTRFIAAFMVVLFHLLHADSGPMAGVPGFLRHIIDAGYVWVGYFFVLSGFILTYQYLGPAEHGSFNRPKFLRARFARIYPGHVLGFLLMLLYLQVFPATWAYPPGGRAIIALDVAATAALVHSWVPQFALTFNFPSWSISTEFFFYLLFPLLIGAAVRYPIRRFAVLAGGALLLEAAACLAYCALAPGGWEGNASVGGPMVLVALKFMPIVRLPEFICGIMLGKLYAERERLGLTADRGIRLLWLSSTAIALGLVGSAYIPFALMHNVVLTLPFAGVILGLALVPHGRLAAFLGNKQLVLLGEASYSLYILQAPFVSSVYDSSWGKHTGLVGWLSFRALLVTSAVAISLLSYRFVEAPARRWIRGGTTA